MKTNRRDFLQTMGLGVTGIGLSSIHGISKSGNHSHQPDDQVLYIGDDIAIAETQYGKVQGFILRDIYNFRGIPYGADTGGKNRFMPPQKPEPWDDVHPAVWWGNTAPQDMKNRYANAYQSFQDHWNYDDVSEDCLKLNVWTPGLNDNKKRPVLVWLHGGGYRNGNGIEQDGYNGENFSREADAVFVSINHRLGPIGFSDLSGIGGSAFEHSGNVGALDMVASLEWVRDNIAGFGGDPDNVTIMGQSGGGAKVCTLMAMEQAKGLFQKAVPLSGSTISALDQETSRKVGEYIVKEAGLTAGEAEKLRDIPWKEYLDIANRAAQKFTEDHGSAGMRGAFGPVADGHILPKGDYFSDSNGLSSEIPMLISSTFHEWSIARDNPEMENWSFNRVKESLKEQARFSAGLGEKAGPVVDAYREAFPAASPTDIMIMILSNRRSLIETANAKSNQNAPIYVAWFGWEPPMFNGRMRAFHCLDICFWFNNTNVMLTHTGGGERPRKLSQKMSAALQQFMKTGNPNTDLLPEWKPYTPVNGETMVLNDISELKLDPDREARRLL